MLYEVITNSKYVKFSSKNFKRNCLAAWISISGSCSADLLRGQFTTRITSYNVCYTKLLRTGFLSVFLLFLFFSCSDGNTPAISDQYQAKSEKRGVAYNFQIPNDANLLGSGVQWFYNWGTTVSDTVNATTRKNDIDSAPTRIDDEP